MAGPDATPTLVLPLVLLVVIVAERTTADLSPSSLSPSLVLPLVLGDFANDGSDSILVVIVAERRSPSVGQRSSLVVALLTAAVSAAFALRSSPAAVRVV